MGITLLVLLRNEMWDQVFHKPGQKYEYREWLLALDKNSIGCRRATPALRPAGPAGKTPFVKKNFKFCARQSGP